MASKKQQKAFADGIARHWFAGCIETEDLWQDTSWWGDCQFTKNGFAALATDMRMHRVWRALNGDEDAIDSFLEGFIGALLVAGSGDALKAEYDGHGRQLSEVERAIDVLSDYCQFRGKHPYIYTESLFRDLPPLLDDVRRFARSETSVNRSEIALVLPRSRKHQERFLRTVHLPCLFVRQMLTHFGRPRYQDVADTINVFFRDKVGDELTADRLRKAYIRSVPSQATFRPTAFERS